MSDLKLVKEDDFEDYAAAYRSERQRHLLVIKRARQAGTTVGIAIGFVLGFIVAEIIARCNP